MAKHLVRFVKRDMLMFPMLLNGDYCHEQVNKIVLSGWQSTSNMEQKTQLRYGCYVMDFLSKKLNG